MHKILQFKNDDLLGKSLLLEKKMLVKMPIWGIHNSIKGNYSVFKETETVFWESSFQTESEVLVTFYPDLKSSYFYLLRFESDKNINKRISIDLPINTALLDNQSQKGSLFWASNAGVELIIPPNSQIEFQLIGISQNEFHKDLMNSEVYNYSLFFLNQKQSIPIFYFSEICLIFQISSFNDKQLNTKDRIYIMEMTINYLSMMSKKSIKDKVSFKNFYKMLLIEKVLRNLPAIREPDLNMLSQDFDYSSKELSRIFLFVFEMTIAEYHRSFHMKYAKLLIEEKQMQISEVSKKLGFNSTNLFSQVFKRQFFYRPKECKSVTRVL